MGVFLNGPARSDRSIWKAWLPALLWLGVIVIESTASLSAENTGKILYPLLHYLFHLDPVRFATWHAVLRKTGHVIGYAVLSLLLFRAWRATLLIRNNPLWSIVWSRVAIGMTALVASLDEWHQSFIPSRTGNVRDVLLDTTAGIVAQILLFFWLGGQRNNQPEPPRGDGPLHEYGSQPTSSVVEN